MANTRSRLLSLLSNAKQALAESESLMAKIPKTGPDAEEARQQLVELRNAVARIEKLLNEPKND